MAAERVYWVDRCLGTNIVPGALRAQSIQVRTYVELYPNDSEVPDHVWIPQVTARGWIILTKDKRIRYSPVEIGAIQKANARYVCLSAGNLRGEQQIHQAQAQPDARRQPRDTHCASDGQ